VTGFWSGHPASILRHIGPNAETVRYLSLDTCATRLVGLQTLHTQDSSDSRHFCSRCGCACQPEYGQLLWSAVMHHQPSSHTHGHFLLLHELLASAVSQEKIKPAQRAVYRLVRLHRKTQHTAWHITGLGSSS